MNDINVSLEYEVVAPDIYRFPRLLKLVPDLLSHMQELVDTWESEHVGHYEENIRYKTTLSLDGSKDSVKEYSEKIAKAIVFFCDNTGLELDTVDSGYRTSGLSLDDVHLTKQGPGGYTVLHTDEGIEEANGEHSVVLYFNDDYEGGALGFLDIGYRMKPTAGDVFIFGCHHKHDASEVQLADKYLSVFRFRTKI